MADTLLQRYMTGHCIEVWKTINTMPLSMREDRRSEISAVAHETIRRVSNNLKILVASLDAVGFEFLVKRQDLGFAPSPGLASPLVEAQPIGSLAIQKFESDIGHRIPMLIREWFLQIRSVCLMGDLPEICTYTSNLIRVAGQPLYADPLVIYPLEECSVYSEGGFPLLEFAPDEKHKSNVSGGGSKAIVVDPDSVDPQVFSADSPKLTFLEYLRLNLQWGGFPGWRHHLPEPQGLLKRLTIGFIPF